MKPRTKKLHNRKFQSRKELATQGKISFFIGDFHELAVDYLLGQWYATIDAGKNYYGPFRKIAAARAWYKEKR